MILLKEILFVKRHIAIIDEDGEVVEVYKNRLVPSDKQLLATWIMDFVETILDKDPDSLCCMHTTVSVFDGVPAPTVEVVVDSEKFLSGVRYD